jgi:preprotein translocase subunit Sss1
MSNRNVSKMMTVAMIIVGALGLTGNNVANDVLTAVGGLGYTAHVINPTKTAS